MFNTLDISRRKAVLAAGAGLLTIGAVALAWSSASATPTTFTPASSAEAAGDISGPCDEAENADKPECAGGSPADAPAPAPAPVAGTADPAAAPETPSSPTAGGVEMLDAAGAGSVTYTSDGTTLVLLDAVAAPGWRVEVEQASGRELDLDFRSGTRRVQVDIEFEDGAVRERVRVRDDATDERVEVVDGATTRVEPGDDRSGPSGGDDSFDAPDDSDGREDRSGSDDSGDRPDDSDGRDDRSGSDDSGDTPDDSDDRSRSDDD